MQENTNKNKIIIAGVVVFVLILSAIYFIFSNNSAPATTHTGTTENTLTFPEFSFKNIFSDEVSVEGGTTDSIVNSSNIDQLVKVWGGRTLGAGIMDNGDILFLDISGEIRQSSSPYTSTNIVSNVKAGCLSAKFSNSGKRALVLCLDGLYLWGDSRFTAIDSNAFDYDFIGSGEDFVYLSGTQEGFNTFVSLGGKISQLSGLHLHEVTILSADSSYVYISEKPNGRSQKLFVYSFKNKDFYYLGDLALDNIGPFQQNYVKEKCVNYTNILNFCLASNFDDFNYTAWRKGLVSSNDQVFAFSFERNKYAEVGVLSERLDTLSIGANATSSLIYSIDKNTLNLFVLHSGQLLEATNE